MYPEAPVTQTTFPLPLLILELDGFLLHCVSESDYFVLIIKMIDA